MLGDAASREVMAPAPLQGPMEQSKGKASGLEGPGAAPQGHPAVQCLGAEARGLFCPKRDDGHPKMCPVLSLWLPSFSVSKPCAHLPTFIVVLKSFGGVFPMDTQFGGQLLFLLRFVKNFSAFH